MGQEQPPQILWRKGVAMGPTQPWCLVPAFGSLWTGTVADVTAAC